MQHLEKCYKSQLHTGGYDIRHNDNGHYMFLLNILWQYFIKKILMGWFMNIEHLLVCVFDFSLCLGFPSTSLRMCNFNNYIWYQIWQWSCVHLWIGSWHCVLNYMENHYRLKLWAIQLSNYILSANKLELISNLKVVLIIELNEYN